MLPSAQVPWWSRQDTLRQRSSGRLSSSVDSPSDDCGSVDTDSNEIDDVSSPTGTQRFSSWWPRLLGACKNVTFTKMSTRFFGHSKPDSMAVQCKNCKNEERMKGNFQNTEDFACSVCREAVKSAEKSGILVCQMCQNLMYASTRNENLDPSLPLCPQCLGDKSAHPAVPVSSAMMTPAAFEAYVEEVKLPSE